MKSKLLEHVERVVDIVINGRPAQRPADTWLTEIIKRGKSTIRYGEKYYAITAVEIKKP